MKTFTLILAAIFTAITLPLSAKEEGEVPFDKCPAPVQTTLTKEATHVKGTIAKVERETKDGAEIFDAKITKPDGAKLTVKVAPDGKVIEKKEKKTK